MTIRTESPPPAPEVIRYFPEIRVPLFPSLQTHHNLARGYPTIKIVIFQVKQMRVRLRVHFSLGAIYKLVARGHRNGHSRSPFGLV